MSHCGVRLIFRLRLRYWVTLCQRWLWRIPHRALHKTQMKGLCSFEYMELSAASVCVCKCAEKGLKQREDRTSGVMMFYVRAVMLMTRTSLTDLTRTSAWLHISLSLAQLITERESCDIIRQIIICFEQKLKFVCLSVTILFQVINEIVIFICYFWDAGILKRELS